MLEVPPSEPTRRGARSTSPYTTGPLALNLSSWPNDVNDDAGSMDTDESDVDFWGRASPNRRTEAAVHADEMESSEDDDDDDDDENMSDGVEEDEVDDGDCMEIFGHR